MSIGTNPAADAHLILLDDSELREVMGDDGTQYNVAGTGWLRQQPRFAKIARLVG